MGVLDTLHRLTLRLARVSFLIRLDLLATACRSQQSGASLVSPSGERISVGEAELMKRQSRQRELATRPRALRAVDGRCTHSVARCSDGK